jgi:hypothetical protein
MGKPDLVTYAMPTSTNVFECTLLEGTAKPQAVVIPSALSVVNTFPAISEFIISAVASMPTPTLKI